MRVISVVNYKGGVGKTTLTANLGAGLADRGKRVLLVDLDPQCSLTNCFYTPEDYQFKVRPKATLKHWYDSFSGGLPAMSLADLTVTPPDVNHAIDSAAGGKLDLLASDILLFRLDLDAAIVAAKDDVDRELFYRRRSLLDGLRDKALGPYDYVLLDCPPGFGLLTQSALVAGRDVLIPAKADYMSTNGLDSLYYAVHEFRQDYGTQVRKYGGKHAGGAFDLGEYCVIFTMVQFRNGPQTANRFHIDLVRDKLRIATFSTMIRQSVAAFGTQGLEVPPILRLPRSDQIRGELNDLIDEFLRLFDGSAGASGARVAAA
ncbi:MAG TPA: ParA family protein [Micromonosporaceae bacterium]|nr:ParA family protein [Micromonosporaceae bacterium]